MPLRLAHLCAVLFALPIAFAGAVGCNKRKPEAAAASDAGAATSGLESAADAGRPADAAVALAFDAGPPITGREDPRFEMLPLFSKLQVEKDNRPDTVRAEAVYDALASKVGLTYADRKQVAGFTVLASYCEKAETDPSIDVVVCEYRDAATLQKGRDIAQKLFKLPRREFVVAKTTWISVTRIVDNGAATEKAKKIVGVLRGLGSAG